MANKRHENRRRPPFCLAEKFGFVALASAAILVFIAWNLALIPLLLFLLLCCTAPFVPSLAFFMPVISRARHGQKGIALTFDDGPDPVSTPVLLKLLAKYNIQATFFVVGLRAAKYPELIVEILAHGHSIGNHSWDHDYFLMLRSTARLHENILKTQKVLKQAGIAPYVFRAPMGITSPRLDRVLQQEGLIAVNYSCRAFDRGNRNIHNLAAKILNKLKPGDIIMLHDLPPKQEQQMVILQQELDHLIGSLAAHHSIAPLADIICRPVMEKN
ncbi:MAG: polysaccharide deacetylase family protein [Desulfopila sp.]